MAMEENKNVVRINIRVSQKIKKYFEEKSAETGVPQSGLMALALEEYIDQKETLKFMTGLDKQKVNGFLKKDNE